MLPAEAIATVRYLVTRGLPESPQAVEIAQRALASAGLYKGAIDADPGPLSRIALACARAATTQAQHQMWCYEDAVPRDREAAAAWARQVRDMGLAGACIMVSSSSDNLKGVWRLERPRKHYVVAAEAARAEGLGVAFMPWVRPLRSYNRAMIRDMVELCDDANVTRVDLDHEFGRGWTADMSVADMAESIVGRLGDEGIAVYVSSYPFRAAHGDGNDDIDPYRDALIRSAALGPGGGWSPQEYSVQPGYKGRSADVYAPGNMQRAAFHRWNVAEDRKHGLGYWPGLAAHAQDGRPGYTAASHFGDAWATQIEHGADGSIIWTRRHLLRYSDVGAQVRSIADRRAHFAQLAEAS